MGNIIFYVKQAKENFTQKPFRAVDSLVLSQLSYLNFARLVPDIEQYVPNVRLGDLKDSVWVETLFSKMKNPKEDKQLFKWLFMRTRSEELDLMENSFENTVNLIMKSFSLPNALCSQKIQETFF